MSERLRAGGSPSQRQIEQTLERGFGKLMALEAELQRRQRAATGGGRDRSDPGVDELKDAISTLREALTVLRTLSSSPGPPRVGYGFVLPARHPVESSDDRQKSN